MLFLISIAYLVKLQVKLLTCREQFVQIEKTIPQIEIELAVVYPKGQYWEMTMLLDSELFLFVVDSALL